ncbi:MAG: type I asparaginase [Bacteroidales bacterium]|nr:type I asparaginase [Bacteroidales bacterium]MCL2133206.1 type I asparaginase [Bacteroidales bacterium]
MTRILVIYTGGTIGMKQNPETGALQPFNFEQIREEMPVLKKFNFTIDAISFHPLIDSSDVQPDFWIKLCRAIAENYDKYSGFVILHGTDTMAYTASALSFMLGNLEKPVILTGSQLPIGAIRTDGMENMVSAIEIAATRYRGRPCISEVCIFFGTKLLRGNRTTKDSAELFGAFRSGNYPFLAEAGIHIKFNHNNIHRTGQWGKPLHLHTNLDTNVAVLKIFPGLNPQLMKNILSLPELRAVVLETYGSGNAPTTRWFIDTLKAASDRGLILINVTSCPTGGVNMEKYANGLTLKEVGVISGYDMTTEAAICKLFLLLGQEGDNEVVKLLWQKNISGEMTIN